LALEGDGTVLGWGDNSQGELGDGTTTQRLTPVPTLGLGSGSGVIAIAAGGSGGSRHGHALKSDGTVLSWGGNGSGQLRRGTTAQRNAPVVARATGSSIVGIAAGDLHASAVDSDGTVLAWGDNGSGELGDGTAASQSTPVEVVDLGSGAGITRIAAGGAHSLALRGDGAVFAWGANGSGQLGDGTIIQRTRPVPVPGLGAGSGVIAIGRVARRR